MPPLSPSPARSPTGDRDGDSHLHPMAECIFLPGKDRTFPVTLRRGTASPLSFHRPCVSDVLVLALPRGSPEARRIKDRQAGGKSRAGSSPSRHRQPQSTGSRAGGLGWQGRPQAPSWPSPSLSLLPELGTLLPARVEKGKKRRKERGGQRGSALEVPAASPVSPASQSHLVLCWGLPGDATDSSSWQRAAKPISAPGWPLHTCTDVAHTWCQRPAGTQLPGTSRCARVSP